MLKPRPVAYGVIVAQLPYSTVIHFDTHDGFWYSDTDHEIPKTQGNIGDKIRLEYLASRNRGLWYGVENRSKTQE